MNLNRSASWPYSFRNVRPLNANVQSPFVACVKSLELTSRPFCTRAKPPCKRSRPICSRCKTVLQTFKTLLFMMQNRPANVQDPFVHDAKPSCKRSRPFCSWCKTVLQTFKGRLPMPPYRIEIKQTHLFILYLIKLKSFIRKFVHSFPVGAYRIRPDVSERATYSHKTPITKLEYKNGSIAKKIPSANQKIVSTCQIALAS